MGQDKPWMTLHNKVEGIIEYTNLLYIPSSKPFDLFHPDRTTRVKLYVKRVFIAEEGVDVLPSYLRFVRGVVDSEDLPLNISREVVQNDVVLQKIKTGVVKRILKELKTKMDKDLPEYMKFWENFGPVVKEGLCDGYEPRDKIIEICRFRTSKTEGEETITLKEYKERMAEGQDAIYYITADNAATAASSPQLEGFKKKGYEVLLLTDSVDDFWVNVLFEYQDIELKSVTRAGSEKDIEDAKVDDGEDEDNKPEEIIKIGEHLSTDLVFFIKDNLGDRVKDVRTTNRLTDSPVCLVAPEGAMDIRMERFMVENKQLAEVNKKVLEINPEHPIIVKLADDLASNQGIKTLSDTVHLLFAQANIIEGEPVDDLAAFSKRMNDVLTKALAA
jgi:molecular chaperone HtpG